MRAKQGAIWVGVMWGLASLVACGNKDDPRPAPLDESGGTIVGAAGEGGLSGGGALAGGAATAGVGGSGGSTTGGESTGGSDPTAGGGGTTSGTSGGGVDGGRGGIGSGAGGTGAAHTGGVGPRTGGVSVGGAGAVGGGSGDAGSAQAGGGTGGVIAPPTLGEPCFEATECNPGELCYRGLTSARSCRLACAVPDVGTGLGCGPRELCTLQEGGLAAACLKLCTPFLAPSDCPETEFCLPNPAPGYTGGVAVDGACIEQLAGATQGGESCEIAPCAGGLNCYSAASSTLGFDHCEALCDPGAASGTLGACPAGEVCRDPLGAGGPACLALCEPFGAATCPADETCPVYQDFDGAQTVVEGHCVKPGTKTLDEPCVPGECGPSLACVVAPPPYGEARTCRPTCDPSFTVGCGTSASCVPVADGTSGVGACETSCTLFGEGTAADCAAEEWCAPTFLGGTAGACVAAGAAALGGSCTASSDCVAGGYCECRFGESLGCASGTSVCAAACLPGAGAGEPDACAADETCVRPTVWGNETASFGVCRATCDFDGGGPCVDGAETCVPGELLADGADACLDVPNAADPVGQYCFVLGVDPGEPCGATDLCLLSAGDAAETCVDACRTSEGAFGTLDHPDCVDPAATCTEIASGLAHGRCE